MQQLLYSEAKDSLNSFDLLLPFELLLQISCIKSNNAKSKKSSEEIHVAFKVYFLLTLKLLIHYGRPLKI